MKESLDTEIPASLILSFTLGIVAMMTVLVFIGS